jgi:hypothetical protein
MLDISDLFNNEDNDRPPDFKVDLSGRPIPKNVRAIIDSGIEIPCDVSYDGLQKGTGDQQIRRFRVKAEIDWTKNWVRMVVVGEMPIDANLIFNLPNENMSGAMNRTTHRRPTFVFEKQI